MTHSGVTLAPELAALITREVLAQEQAPQLAQFPAAALRHRQRFVRRPGRPRAREQ